MAILLGTIVGGSPPRRRRSGLFGALMMVFALLCWGASLLIPRPARRARSRVPNIARSTGSLLRICGSTSGCGGARW
jgi:acyl-[acyl-carrier-protein]-phospholipid O-acyltransferase/long-chain-fatty-acid--[acyl-carrier-protein] ligase